MTKSITISNDLTLPYVEQGSPDGVPLILLHAIADSWHSFERVLPHLPEFIHAFAVTQRGHADASRPGTGYRPRDFSEDLAAFMDALHLEAAIVAGGSSGGFIARRFAIDYPKRTLGLVLLGSPAMLRDKPAFQQAWDSTISKLTDPVDPSFVRSLAQSTLSRPVPKAFLDTMIQENLKVPALVWKETFVGLMEDESFDELRKISSPTLIVWGDRDAFLTREDQKRLEAAITTSRLVVYHGAGHAVYWEEPERIAVDLGAFARELGTTCGIL